MPLLNRSRTKLSAEINDSCGVWSSEYGMLFMCQETKFFLYQRQPKYLQLNSIQWSEKTLQWDQQECLCPPPYAPDEYSALYSVHQQSGQWAECLLPRGHMMTFLEWCCLSKLLSLGWRTPPCCLCSQILQSKSSCLFLSLCKKPFQSVGTLFFSCYFPPNALTPLFSSWCFDIVCDVCIPHNIQTNTFL